MKTILEGNFSIGFLRTFSIERFWNFFEQNIFLFYFFGGSPSVARKFLSTQLLSEILSVLRENFEICRNSLKHRRKAKKFEKGIVVWKIPDFFEFLKIQEFQTKIEKIWETLEIEFLRNGNFVGDSRTCFSICLRTIFDLHKFFPVSYEDCDLQTTFYKIFYFRQKVLGFFSPKKVSTNF